MRKGHLRSCPARKWSNMNAGNSNPGPDPVFCRRCGAIGDHTTANCPLAISGDELKQSHAARLKKAGITTPVDEFVSRESGKKKPQGTT